jgi:hypothetical protein
LGKAQEQAGLLTAFGKDLKRRLITADGRRCAIYLEEFLEAEIQIDHRIPFQVAGDRDDAEEKAADFMLLCGSANRAKPWSCERCVNWRELRNPAIRRRCYWAYPNTVHLSIPTHVAKSPRGCAGARERRITRTVWTNDTRSGSMSAFNAASCINPRIAKCAIMKP